MLLRYERPLENWRLDPLCSSRYVNRSCQNSMLQPQVSYIVYVFTRLKLIFDLIIDNHP